MEAHLTDLLSYSPEELREILREKGYRPWIFSQCLKWIYSRFVTDFESMTDISKEDRQSLKNEFRIGSLETKDIITGGSFESTKFLFKTADNNFIESVLIYSDDSLYSEDDSP